MVGTHAHVPQPIAQVNGTWVAYGLGNFISNMPLPNNSWPPSSQDGVILGVTVAEQSDGRFVVERPTVTPTWVDRDHGWLIRPSSPTSPTPRSAKQPRPSCELPRPGSNALRRPRDCLVTPNPWRTSPWR